jgi:hypothetical protein
LFFFQNDTYLYVNKKNINIMKRIIRLTESDLTRIVRRVIKEQEAPATGNGGPLAGQLVSRVDGKTFQWGDTVEFKFPGLRNAGQGDLVINSFMGQSDNMTTDLKLPMTLPAGGNTGPFTVKVLLEQGGTTTRPDMNGVVNYDVSAYLVTNSKKGKYQIYCRGEFFVQ